jgi:hypothetical protein
VIPDPFTDPDSWDTLTIGGVSFGGAFKFDGKLLSRKLDRRHAERAAATRATRSPRSP